MDECNKTNTEKNSYGNSLIKNSSRKNSSLKIKCDRSPVNNIFQISKNQTVCKNNSLRLESPD